jgi:hypothetical protein
MANNAANTKPQNSPTTSSMSIFNPPHKIEKHPFHSLYMFCLNIGIHTVRPLKCRSTHIAPRPDTMFDTA